ncbi:ABC transporter permease [Bacillus toyonensis]|uniref:FtsX-like permease family protein n=1 Tax=Bacillus toyonensis TaxID=155322 RepID=UPI000BF10088|nr:FtsX-like permease family protein [Bacillus toyonensis]PEM13144.1 ABC transporter permease [Bacillus toyonensis]PGA43643.1 ABC transporter permease [Bacillus toyonensis]PGB25965.1 ABC transporter permease [Bacillus toyonensis]PGC32728.1 ABC transporter permease [Bacillus toyonensis]PHF83458.1 ABC transporter permease [Bacillus toyonensis]
MSFRQLAWNNVIRNKRLYLGYFLSSVFTVMIFFTFEVLAFHPQFSGKLGATSESMIGLGAQGFKIAQYLIIFFSFFFILYSVGTFLKTRKHEFGILTFHGMTNFQLKQLIFIENMLIGSSSIIVGIGIGLIFGKLILLVSESIFVLKGGLPFYFPTKAILVTSISFLLLFLLVSFFTTRIIKLTQVIELMKSEEKPKPEPRVSKWLAIFAILFISIGYAAAFYLDTALKTGNHYIYALLAGVFFSVLGTYFLFTQLSFYLIKTLQKRDHIFFKKTNLLTISELSYRITDNAKTLFIVAILSTVTLTSIGVCLAIGSRQLALAQSPYAFTYTSYKGNVLEKSHVSEIEKQLNAAGFSYKLASYTIIATHNRFEVMKLTDFNATAKILGYPTETLKNEQDSLILPSKNRMKQQSENELKKEASILKEGDTHIHLSNSKLLLNNKMRPSNGVYVVVADSVYEKLKRASQLQENIADWYTNYGYLIQNWTDTEEISKKITKIIDSDTQKGKVFYNFHSLYLDWMESKRFNAILATISVLVGIVFFVFAISFLYFRLFTDLERDKKQYEMLSKIGLTQKELKRIVTQQLSILCFIPIIVAIIHSSVALMALQYLVQRKAGVDLPVTGNSILIFTSFIFVQFIYYLIIRRNYLHQMIQ